MNNTMNLLSDVAFGEVGLALSTIFIILFIAAVVYIVFLMISHKKMLETFKTDLADWEKQINELAQDKQSIEIDRDRLRHEVTKLSHDNAELQMQLTCVQEEIEIVNQKSETADKDQLIATLKEQVKVLSQENENLKVEKDYSQHLSGYTIEDYFPKIDAAFEYADSCKYNADDPQGSYIAQRQQLNEIRRLLEAYRSQR